MKKRKKIYTLSIVCLMMITTSFNLTNAQNIKLETEQLIADDGLHFDGKDVDNGTRNRGEKYDYFFGNRISAHGDCVKTYGDFVFLTWYKGDKENRHVMLSRYNKKTKKVISIEFPHRHTGYLNQWWIGESHNTIAVGVSQLDGTIHLLYDMHAYSKDKPKGGAFAKDYFRYSYSKKNAATVADKDFKLSLFVKNKNNGYKHLGLNGTEDYDNFSGLTYPKFFSNKEGDLFVYMRKGGNNNGSYKFAKYNASTSEWSTFTHFNVLDADLKGAKYNWGLYGSMKYVNGKIRIGFQRRLANNKDKYQYQNGFYYAYSDDKNGKKDWKDCNGKKFSLPLIKADKIKISEPGNLVSTKKTGKVQIIKGFDWTVTDNGDVHFIGKVIDLENDSSVNVHTYRKKEDENFKTTTQFAGAEAIYTSGNDIYIVGLKGGRVFIEKAKGGTSNFTRVYEETKGKRFRHGHVYINDGKVYYYLMEKKSGSAQPLYLKIIDLGIAEVEPAVSVSAPENFSTIKLGKTITLKAKVKMAHKVEKVNFRINKKFYAQDETAPYSKEWTPTEQGEYYVDVVAIDVKGNRITSDQIKVKIFSSLDDISGIYRFKNVGTGKYLDSNGTAVGVGSDSYNDDRQWRVVRVEDDYYNIDSEYDGRGCLQSQNDGVVVNSTVESKIGSNDKMWKAISLGDNVYRFENKREGRDYLYANPSNLTVGWASGLGDNTKWELEKVVSTRSDAKSAIVTDSNNTDKAKEVAKVTVYPNPANSKFTIQLKGIENARVYIYDLSGAVVYKTKTAKSSIHLRKNHILKSGVYIVKAIGDNGQSSRCKLMIK